MGDLDQRQRAAGELGGDAAHQFLVRMVRTGEIERRFAELDFKRVEEAEEHPGQHQHQQGGVAGNVIHRKTLGGHIHADRGQQNHRFVGHDLDQLALRPDEAVGRTRLVGSEHEEDRRQGQRENDQQQVRPREEQRAGEDHQQQEEPDVDVLRLPDDDVLLLPQLQDVIQAAGEWAAPGAPACGR